MKFNQDPKFSKELKKLSRKYKRLSQDFEVFTKAQVGAYSDSANEYFVTSFFNGKNATVVHKSNDGQLMIVKARLHSSDLRQKALRVIYQVKLYDKSITFIEIYAKNQKANEDKKRWQEYL